jgi:DNA-binding HxlR family transcriptional regulator
MTTLSPARHEVMSTTSPLWECVVGLRLALAGGGTDTRRLLAEDIVLLPALLRHATVLPHFLLPPPEQAHPSFADELAQVASLSPAVVMTELGYAFGSTFGWQEPEEVLPAQLRWVGRSPERALECLVAELERYWRLRLAERCAREELVREDALRIGGAVSADLGLVGALDPAYRAEDGAVWATNLPGAPRKLQPSPLILVASVLPRGALTIACDARGIAWEGRPPMLSYLVRGASGTRRGRATDELVTLVGERRAAIIRTLVTPLTTSDLALRLGVTAGAISQQLAHLQSAAGLLVRTREHPYVHYRLSARGEQLLAVFEP